MHHLSTPQVLLMVRPAAFGYNTETALTNPFQQAGNEDIQHVQRKALEEFDRVVIHLRKHKIEVIVVTDLLPPKPDAIFPNNWISTLPNGTVITYPMYAVNRRAERRADVVEMLKEKFVITQLIDISGEEEQNQFLEGTGSVVFDHTHQIAYACRSERTHESVFRQLCSRIGYRDIIFDAVDENHQAIYHTNVIMWVGEKVAALCIDALKNENDQDRVLDQLAATGHKVIAISYDQMKAFAGNMYEVRNEEGDPFLLMSEKAYQSLLPGQLNEMSKHAEPLVVEIDTIERYGGGGIRCMVAGIYLQKK